MKLKRLWIDGFKNLNNFEIDFTDKDGITVLIGNNGSGKSNVLDTLLKDFVIGKKIELTQAQSMMINEYFMQLR
ncbi:MAG: hypothetical protein DRG11_04980 [Epsilonproteobacteria bacterium]|nr:MAG: hypothetical protein DRG11_04980 [Campylobacterota bacterium]